LNFDPNLYFLQFGEEPTWPEGYETLRWAHFTTLTEASVTTGTTSTDGVTPDDVTIAVTSTTTTPTQYRIVCDLSDMLLATNPLPLLQKTAERVGVVMAQAIDTVIQTTIMAGTYVIRPSARARSALSVADVLSFPLLNQASALLHSYNAPTFDGMYVAVIHPFQEYDLRGGTTVNASWIETVKYSQPEKIFNGEIGALFGIRIVVSSHVNSISSTTTVYPALVIGKQAYGVGFVQRPQVFITDMVPSDSDPAAQRRKVAAKCAFGVAILQQAAMVRIETGATSIASL
jgi:N4-gp56 family major capsid protein